MSAEEKVIDIIVEQLSVDRDNVVPSASFVDDLGADSLDLYHGNGRGFRH